MKPALISFVLASAAACGGGPDPILRNVPQPNPAAVAGAAAALAGAATLADPAGAAKRQEENKEPPEKRPLRVKETVPSDVFDRAERPPTAPATPAPAQAPSDAKPATEDQALEQELDRTLAPR